MKGILSVFIVGPGTPSAWLLLFKFSRSRIRTARRTADPILFRLGYAEAHVILFQTLQASAKVSYGSVERCPVLITGGTFGRHIYLPGFLSGPVTTQG